MQSLLGICRRRGIINPRNYSTVPWFVDATAQRAHPPHLPSPPALSHTNELAPLPSDVPSPIRALHSALASSPHIDKSTLLVCTPPPREPGPPLPMQKPRGRRQRGGTYVGKGVEIEGGWMWRWFVMAQVKEGTEKRGGVESVVRLVRRTLLTSSPPLPLGPNTKKGGVSGWAMIDAGQFAVHILSKQARDKYFNDVTFSTL